MLHGCVPVNVIVRSVDSPSQIVASPLITAVGKGLTVTVAAPVKEVPVQFRSLTAVREYVVVTDGDTLMV